MKFARRENWDIHLNEYLNAQQRRVVRLTRGDLPYGRFDCCTFSAGAVKAMTGTDPMADFRGQYKTKDEAAKALRDIGAGTLYNTLCSIFGNPVPGAFGRHGDVAYLDKACGIVIGRYALFLTTGGFARAEITHIEKAFRVG